MPTLKHITCTGIDRNTNITALKKLQEAFPVAEFGVLLSAKPQESPRYADPKFIRELRGHDLNLSLHLCGRLARAAVGGDWSGLHGLIGGDIRLFRRIQLNVAGYTRDQLPEHVAVSVPEGVEEVIIQQKDAGSCDLFLEAVSGEPRLSVLLDASGGRGVRGAIGALGRRFKTGFAGGLDECEVKMAMPEIYYADGGVGDFWVDAESAFRNEEDAFCTHRAARFLEAASESYRFWMS